MTKSCRVSVVMPVYNGEVFIKEAMESILKQTLIDFEFIIVDDNSIDNTVAIIEAVKDERIKLIKNKSNYGNYKSRNIGNAIAKGKYIAVMDADDIALENRLMIQYEYLEKNKNVGSIGSCGTIINDKGKQIGTLSKRTKYQDLKIYLLQDNCFLHPSLMIKRSLLVKHSLKYDEKFKYASDYDFMSKCSSLFPIRNIPDVLLSYRRHAKQISTSKRKEQIMFADKVRLKQLTKFKVRFSDTDKEIYLKLMKRETLSAEQLEEALSLLNLLMEKNTKLKLYGLNKLYIFFDILLQTAIYIKNKTVYNVQNFDLVILDPIDKKKAFEPQTHKFEQGNCTIQLSKELVIVPIGGLCNRIRAIASAKRISKLIGFKCVVVWAWGNYFDLFESDDFINVTNDLPHNLKEYKTFKTLLFEAGGETLNQKLPLSKENKVLIYTGHLFNDVDQESITEYDLINYFPKPSKIIKQKVNYLRELMFNKNELVGIHIRRTDNKISIKSSPDYLFENRIEEILTHGKTIFLSTDNNETKEKFTLKFPNIVTCEKKSRIIRWPKNKFDLSETIEDFVDLLLLASCDYVIGTQFSSFSSTAMVLNGSAYCESLTINNSKTIIT